MTDLRTCYELALKIKKLSIAVTYIYPLNGVGEHGKLARRFLESYRRYKPNWNHTSVIVCNGAKPNARTEAMFSCMPNPVFLEHDDSGWDIGGYQKAAREVPCDLMVFFGGSTVIRGDGWLTRMAQVFLEYGTGLYGAMANLGSGVYPHIRTTGFWMPPSLLNAYPKRIITNPERHEFEHGKTCLTEWVKKQRLPALMVTWDGVYDKWDKRLTEGLHQGNQSALIVWDRLNLPPYYRVCETVYSPLTLATS